jgi:hypothetical protein
MNLQEKILDNKRSSPPWGLSIPHDHMDMNNDNSTQVRKKGSILNLLSRGPPRARKESHDMAGWTLSVIHVTTCHRTIWYFPYADSLPRAYKMISSPSSVKSPPRMGNMVYLTRLCGHDGHASHLPHRFSSPDVNHPSMAMLSTMYKTLPTNSRVHSSSPSLANLQSSLLCAWPSWEFHSARSLLQTPLVLIAASSPPCSHSRFPQRSPCVVQCCELLNYRYWSLHPTLLLPLLPLPVAHSLSRPPSRLPFHLGPMQNS